MTAENRKEQFYLGLVDKLEYEPKTCGGLPISLEIKPYNWDTEFQGRFLITESPDKSIYLALGKHEEEFANHQDCFGFIKLKHPETEQSEVKSGGFLSIYPEYETFIASGESQYFNKGFLREDFLPLAREIYRASKGKINEGFMLDDNYEQFGKRTDLDSSVLKNSEKLILDKDIGRDEYGFFGLREVICLRYNLDKTYIDLTK